MDRNYNIPFHKISGKNGELFHLNNTPLFARIKDNLSVAMHDKVEFTISDPNGNVLSQLGKIIDLFFLESTQTIIAQVEREPDKQMISLDISQICKNNTVENEFLTV